MTSAAAPPVERMTRSNASTGRIYFWQGGSLWIGEGGGRTDWHAHHAHQIALVPQGRFRFRTGKEGEWADFEGALVPGHCHHQFEVARQPMAHLFVEPESRAGRALLRHFGAGGVSRLPADECRAVAQRLFEVFDATPVPGAMVAAAAEAVAQLAGAGTEHDLALDPRLARALVHLRDNLHRPLPLGEVAAAVALSPSRFRHLFVDQTGSSYRAYLLWLRINRAIAAVQAGASWTEAAHDAGFADSAHLTRTHRRVFGIEPSAVRPLAPPAA